MDGRLMHGSVSRFIQVRPVCVAGVCLARRQGWSYRLSAAVDRVGTHTYYELAFSKYDLLGSDYTNLDEWRAGLRFGFSYLVNDGDTEASQQGWAGYYPHSIVYGKQASKLGSVVLDTVVPKSESNTAAVAFSELGAAGSGCAWTSQTDVAPEYYAELDGYTRLRCLENCASSPSCHGFEFDSGSKKCQLWNRTPQARRSAQNARPSAAIVCTFSSYAPDAPAAT